MRGVEPRCPEGKRFTVSHFTVKSTSAFGKRGFEPPKLSCPQNRPGATPELSVIKFDYSIKKILYISLFFLLRKLYTPLKDVGSKYYDIFSTFPSTIINLARCRGFAPRTKVLETFVILNSPTPHLF